MRKKFCLAMSLVLMLAGCSCAKTATSVLQDAQTAMGAPTSIQYAGTGTDGTLGEALTAGQAWPLRELSGYTRSIDYDQRSAREELNFAKPVFGGQHQNTQVNGDRAWIVGANGPAPRLAGRAGQLAPADERQLFILLTPHGFVKGAMAAGNASLAPGEGANVISFTALGKYKVSGTLDATNKVTKVETVVPDPMLGDTPLVATYSGYKDFGGVQFPQTIAIAQGGFPVRQLAIISVTPNAAVDLPVPAKIQSAAIPPMRATSTMLAPGVWHITGGTHHSVVVDLSDGIAVIEAPLNEERSLAVIAEAKKLVPNKPIRYLLTTHHHFEHVGGMRTYVAEGATIVTHQSNVRYFEKTVVRPATLVPDMQSKSPKAPKFKDVAEKTVIGDSKQRIEIYPTSGDTHTTECTLIYLPGPRMLVEADSFRPGPAGDGPAPPMALVLPDAVRLYDDIQALKLDVATIVPIHGLGPVPLAELRKFIGR